MSRKKKHIVLLTTWFLPLESVAVNRMLAFAKYLNKNDFDVSIVTQGTETNFGKSDEFNATIHRLKPTFHFLNPKLKTTDSKFVHYSKTAIRIVRMKIFGDDDKNWKKKAINKLNEIHQIQPIDLIISSFSPAAPHLAALDFCKKNIRVKWVVDMRDEMSLNPQSSESVKSFYRKTENEINKHADALISVSQPIVNYFKEVIPDLKYYVEVRNGFDEEVPNHERNFSSTFTILHAGSFYGARKPDTFFKALERVYQKNELPEKWIFICAGASHNFSIPDVLKKHVSIISRVSQIESIKLMVNSDLNLLIQPPTGRMGVYTGKVFDYLSVQRPILAVVDASDVAAKLVIEMQSGYVANFDNIDEIELALETAIRDWKSRHNLIFNLAEIEKLHRKYQVEKLNLLIDDLVNEK